MPREVRYSAGAVIYVRGERAGTVFLLRTGSAGLEYTDIETGSDQHDAVAPGEFFGVGSALGRYPREENARAARDSTVIVYATAEFERLAMNHSRIMMTMLRVFSRRLRCVHKKVSGLTKTAVASPEDGLYHVADYFLKNRRWDHARYVLHRYLAYYPAGKYARYARERLELAEAVPVSSSAPVPGLPVPGADEAARDGNTETGSHRAGVMAEAGPFEHFVKTYRSGEIIFSEFESGGAFYVITSGRVELVRLFGNVEKILDILVSNDMFGEMAILENSPRSATAIALDEVTVLEFNRDSFDVLMRGNPPFALRLLKMFAKRLYDAKRRYRALALKEPQARVASVFVMLDEARPVPPGGSASREFPVTALDIARWAALSPVEAEKALDRFVSQRRIEIRGDSIVIKNIGFFFRLAHSGGVRRKIPEKAAVFL